MSTRRTAAAWDTVKTACGGWHTCAQHRLAMKLTVCGMCLACGMQPRHDGSLLAEAVYRSASHTHRRMPWAAKAVASTTGFGARCVPALPICLLSADAQATPHGHRCHLHAAAHLCQVCASRGATACRLAGSQQKCLMAAGAQLSAMTLAHLLACRKP
jgi:hypothetical protein